MSQEPISIIVLEPVVDSMAALVKVLEQTPLVELITVPSVAEAHQVALQFQPCVMLISLRGSLDGAMQVDLLKRVEKPIRSGLVKPLIISTVKNHPMAGVISTIGVKDYVVEPTTTKSLMFKMNLFFKAINAQREKAAAALKNNETRVFKAKPAEEDKTNTITNAKAIGKYKPALQLAEDTFLFKRAQPRKVNSKILLEAEGPSPETGEWVQQPTKANEIQKWKWKPKVAPGEEGVDQDEGSGWVHEGEKPSFSGNPGRWLMSSTKPRLDYFRGGQAIANKVETDENGEVLIADDSQAARENLILNKTLAQQAQELQLKKALEEQEAEELKKLMVVEKPKPKKEKADAIAADEEDEEKGAFSKLAKKIREKKKFGVNKSELGAESEGEAKWNDKSENGEDDESIHRKLKSAKRSVSDKSLELNSEDEEILGSAADLELKSREELLEGLANEKLNGEKNRREAGEGELKKKLRGEKALEGLDEEQLKDDVNLREKASSSLRKRNLNSGKEEQQESSDELDEIEKKNKLQQRKRNLNREGSEKKPKHSREELEKLAKQKIKEILELMAEEENTPEIEKEPEALDDEGLKKRKEQLGLSPDLDIDPKELRRLEKAERKKKQKQEIAELEEAIKAGEGPLQAIFFAEESPDWNEDSPEKVERKERNFRAIESADADLYERDETLAALKKKKELNKESAAGENYFYLLQSEVQPEGGTWITADGQWLYLGPDTVNSGFESIEDILPSWIFDGSEEPLLLKEEAKWRFTGLEPYLVQSPGEISFALKDSLKAYTKTKLERDKKKAAAEQREKEEEERAQAEAKEKESIETEPEEKNAPPRVHEKRNKNKVFADPSLEKPANEKSSSLDRSEDNVSGGFGKVTRELGEKSGFGKVQLEEMLSGELGSVSVEDRVSREGDVSFEQSEEVQKFKFTVKELLVFVKINDAKQMHKNLSEEVPVILKLMRMAHPHLSFECVKDTAPLALAESAESIHSSGCLLVSTNSPDGKFAHREKIISFHFAKAIGQLLEMEKLIAPAKAA